MVWEAGAGQLSWTEPKMSCRKSWIIISEHSEQRFYLVSFSVNKKKRLKIKITENMSLLWVCWNSISFNFLHLHLEFSQTLCRYSAKILCHCISSVTHWIIPSAWSNNYYRNKTIIHCCLICTSSKSNEFKHTLFGVKYHHTIK